MEKVNLAQKFSLFDEYWSPKIVGELNGQVVKIAKLKGEFLWHSHEAEDEFFMVIKGRMVIKMPDQDVSLEAGEFFVARLSRSLLCGDRLPKLAQSLIHCALQ